MAEPQNQEGYEQCDASNINTMASEGSHGVKRPHDSNHVSGPPQKSPCTSPAPAAMQSLGENEQPEDKVEEESVNVPAPEQNPRSRRKSLRRSSRGRRSLPAFSSSSQPLCETISLSLPDDERLEMLMKAAMQRTVQRVKSSLYTIPGVDTETLQTQVESLHEEWDSLAKDFSREIQNSLPPAESDPVVNMTTARIQEDINRLQAECSSWESLLHKHRFKADELNKCVERGEDTGVPLDPSCFAKSSQSQLILNKPDYKTVLTRQQKLLQNMELVMDSQCCIMKDLLSFHEKSQLLLKETSARLASSAGFEDLPSSPIRQLVKAHISSVSS
ncbi:kinetochore-associated protein DSN1 homolog isoform X2 [Danio aesculapii]|uniref:kinetochore-associated protein DSN1 homolog isoform X2 n=1 Tax=Danio aesculapii TaxID=1142201 RepID=UPI0024BF18C4|nr:kinetochore-associated protein DSN1 homolog isoform X2 [Danio aesculapii]